ncbi:MAG TPA: hypothetical protein VM529_05340 [Gemmata sp.]|jgi:hypothetical protein|nr:hypothetical protein [Gemmata sp.]
MRIFSRLLLAALAGALASSGCSRGPEFVPVSGKVVMNGKALGNVKVEFHPDPDAKTTGPSSTATTDAEGNFTLACPSNGNEAGAVAGNHRVILSDLDVYGTVFVGRGDYRSEDAKGPKEVPKIPRVPAQYSDLSRTPLKLEVKAGVSPVTLEVKK